MVAEKGELNLNFISKAISSSAIKIYIYSTSRKRSEEEQKTHGRKKETYINNEERTGGRWGMCPMRYLDLMVVATACTLCLPSTFLLRSAVPLSAWGLSQT